MKVRGGTSKQYEGKLNPECEYKQKHRRCLMCHKPFVSEWAGERVCKRCKSTSVWREGKASYSLAD